MAEGFEDVFRDEAARFKDYQNWVESFVVIAAGLARRIRPSEGRSEVRDSYFDPLSNNAYRDRSSQADERALPAYYEVVS